MTMFDRTELVKKYHAMIGRGEPIIGGGAGTEIALTEQTRKFKSIARFA